MKICFISGHKNSGRCGITDNVELIAKEFENLGHEIKQCFVQKGCGELTDLPDADLYSIQFAPYAYATNGFPHQILKYLAINLKNRKVHLNFHEIWVGTYPRATWKEKLIGRLQKKLILGFVNKCKPAWITSSNSAAIDRLKRDGVQAKLLYLCGNIPYSSAPEEADARETFKVAFFGTPYLDFPYVKLEKKLLTLSRNSGKKLEIILIGHQREDAGTNRILSMCKKKAFLIKRTGQLSANLISEQLQKCTLGVSTTPFDVIGKSSATAAMLEHGLAILAYDDGDTAEESLFIPDQFKDQIFLINDNSSVDKLLQHIEKPRQAFFDGVSHTARKILELVS